MTDLEEMVTRLETDSLYPTVNRDALLPLLRELREARKVMAKLPKTADGAVITPGSVLWYLIDGTPEAAHFVATHVPEDGGVYYSTREAALAAQAKGKK